MADHCYTEPLDIASSTVLITGGSSGIGFGLARCFVQEGAMVIITGRREKQLKEAVEELNRIGKKKAVYCINDVQKAEQRVALYDWVTKEYPETNILINNAGIQQRHPFIPHEVSSENISWEEREQEIHINICAPMHLSHLFIAHFRQLNKKSAIINVSSGLAFTPLALIPIYSASKAAIHSFTMSLRFELANVLPNIQVYEVVPPAVQTNLGGSHAFGEPLDEYCEATYECLKKGQQEIGYKRSEEGRKLKSREESDHHFVTFNQLYKNVFQNVKH